MNDFLQSLRNGQADKQRSQKTRKSYDNSYHYTSPRFHTYSGYPGNRNQQMKRQPAHHQNQNQHRNKVSAEGETPTTVLTDAIETLNIHMESLAKNQEFLINAQERAVDMMERQAEAIEEIVRFLHSTTGHSFEKVQAKPEPEDFEHHYSTAEPKEEPVAPPVEKPAQEPVEASKPAAIRRRRKVIKREILDLRVEKDSKLLPREEIMDIINNMREEGATFDEVAKHLIKLGQPTFSGRGEWHAQTIHRLCNKKK